jgi:hypothetical protein
VDSVLPADGRRPARPAQITPRDRGSATSCRRRNQAVARKQAAFCPRPKTTVFCGLSGCWSSKRSDSSEGVRWHRVGA